MEPNFFRDSERAADSISLPAGIHEDVMITNLKTGYEGKDGGERDKKQFKISFTKVGKGGREVGMHEYSTFKIDQEKSYAIDSFGGLMKNIWTILSLFYTEKELDKKFDPLAKILLEKEEKVSKRRKRKK